jgi:anti-sigma B factor antagonist/stage II sporulation protein AA (anti-sigma F factor antagonist)
MDIKITHKQGSVPVIIIRLEGEFDAASSDQVKHKAHEVIDEGAEYVLLDLSGVPFISSAGIRLIYSLQNQLHPKKPGDEGKAVARSLREGTYISPRLKILNPSNQAMNVFRMIGIDSYIEIYEDEEEAISSFVPG